MHLSESDWQHVDERARNFIGRAWVFELVRTFLASDIRMLVIAAPPGSGKTAIAARLAQASAGQIADDPALPIPAGTLAAAVFCQVGVSLLGVAQDLAGQLATLPGFAAEQQLTVAPQVTITGPVTAQIAGNVTGSRVAGVMIDLGRLGAERAFVDGLALPLKRLSEKPGFRPPVLLVDSLDEAYRSDVAQTLPRKLADLSGARLILTARDNGPWLEELGLRAAVAAGDAVVINLDEDAPAGLDDVAAYAGYAAGRLQGGATDEAVAVLARRIGENAQGNFLYAYHVVGGLLASSGLGDLDATAAAQLPLPTGGLDGVYAEFLRRVVGPDRGRWRRLVRPVLAPISIARGFGLDTTQLAAIGSILAEQDVSLTSASDVTEDLGQFLDGPRPDGPFLVWHQSFAEFLRDGTQTSGFRIDPGETHAAIVDGLLGRDTARGDDRGLKPWEVEDWATVDRYGMEYLAAHLGAFDPEGLVRLLANYHYLDAKLNALGYGPLLDDFEHAAPIPVGSDAERRLRSLRGALRLSGQAILRNPAELPTQLIGRLSGRSDASLQHLVASARDARFESWLEPLGPSLAAPGGVFRVSLRGHEGTPRFVAITPDGHVGVSSGPSSPDRTVRVWDLDAAMEPLVFGEEASPGQPLALSGDGQLLMTPYGNEVRLWDCAKGVLAARFDQHQSPVLALAIADASPVAATGDADGMVLLWDLHRRELTRPLRRGPGGIHALALTPDGLQLAVLADEAVELWDVAGAQVKQQHSIESVVERGWSPPIAIARDASSIAFGNPLQSWNVGTDEVRPVAANNPGRPLAITIDGGRVLTAGSDDRGSDVWNLDGRLAWALPDRDAKVSSAALSRDGRWAITAYYDHKVVAWDLDPAMPAAGTASAAEPIRRVAIAADGRHAAAFTEAGASIWNLETGQAMTGSAVGAGALDAIREQLAIEGGVVGRLEAQRLEADVGAGDHPDGDGLRPSEERLGPFVHRDFYNHRWAVGAGGRLALHWVRPRAKTSEAEEDPGVGRHTYAVDVVDVDRHELVARLSGHSAHIVDGAISDDGRRAATGSIGRIVRVWDLPSGDLRSTLPAHSDPVSAVDLSADGTLVVSASIDGFVRVWDVEGGRILATFSGDNPMVDCAMSGDGLRVVAGDRAGRVHILRLRGARD